MPQIEVAFLHRCQWHPERFGEGRENRQGTAHRHQGVERVCRRRRSSAWLPDAETHAEEDKKFRELVARAQQGGMRPSAYAWRAQALTRMSATKISDDQEEDGDPSGGCGLSRPRCSGDDPARISKQKTTAPWSRHRAPSLQKMYEQSHGGRAAGASKADGGTGSDGNAQPRWCSRTTCWICRVRGSEGFRSKESLIEVNRQPEELCDGMDLDAQPPVCRSYRRYRFYGPRPQG